eukprot:3500976-Prymnesium_polylepis.2
MGGTLPPRPQSGSWPSPLPRAAPPPGVTAPAQAPTARRTPDFDRAPFARAPCPPSHARSHPRQPARGRADGHPPRSVHCSRQCSSPPAPAPAPRRLRRLRRRRWRAARGPRWPCLRHRRRATDASKRQPPRERPCPGRHVGDGTCPLSP